MQTLDALRIREDLAASDLRGKETTPQPDAARSPKFAQIASSRNRSCGCRR
jgi:hypothetical protein